METTIKQAEEDRNRSLESAKRMYEEYRPLKEDIDRLRNNIGLDRLPDVTEDDPKLTTELVWLSFITSCNQFKTCSDKNMINSS